MIDFKDNSILIVPNALKNDIIKDIRINNNKINIKFFSLEEFIKNLTFTYDERTLYELMKLENINYDIAKLYLDNIKYVNSESNNSKLNKLFNIKNSIDEFLIKDNLFRLLIKNKDIYIYGYDYISKYNQYILKSIDNVYYIEKKYNNYSHDVYKFNSLEDEVTYVAEKISELIDSGIDINNIFIANLDNNYYKVIKRIFNMYNIPINLNDKYSLYQTNIGKFFINNLDNNIDELLLNIQNRFDMENSNNYSIYNKLVEVLNKFYFTNDYESISDNIMSVMKTTYLDIEKYKNAVNEISLENNIIENDKHIFLVGFNLNKFPKVYKDEEYISDNIKPDNLEKSYELNVLYKELYYKIICNIKNLYISYKTKFLNESFYPSLLIDEYKMNEIENNITISKYSDKINKILLTKSLDNLIKYNIKNSNLSTLYNNYKLNYMRYDNKYTGIDKNLLYAFLNNNYNLSYSSMDNYYHCSFRFYLSNILKLDYFEETIQTYIGNLFHYILSKMYDKDFDFNSSYNHFIENNPYPKSNKSEYFLNKVIDELKFVINTLKYQNTLMDMDEALYEKKINVEKKNVININFKGFIDKLLKKDNVFVIIDYKTYIADINLYYLPYGLSMQLPTYLYLTKNYAKDAEIIGFYLQQVLFGNFNKETNKTLSELKRNNLKLKGYSLGNEDKLRNFDSTLEDSELIHGMKLTEKGFGYYSKVLTENQINNIYKLTNDKIDECIDGIVNAKFNINPKQIAGKNIGCNYCKYKDICFVTNKDIVELEEIKNLDFLDN